MRERARSISVTMNENVENLNARQESIFPFSVVTLHITNSPKLVPLTNLVQVVDLPTISRSSSAFGGVKSQRTREGCSHLET